MSLVGEDSQNTFLIKKRHDNKDILLGALIQNVSTDLRDIWTEY